ncbi:unnamed protein product [Clonostachys solani]|uniref:Swiss Army Knife RNA repair protein HAD domain-containing protein n=1 Tax=Clonostachys solani TaxID=160281 RepID=A0A9N9VWR7_9HYPO|nr:unnamed protein product [Clonostachys solani]
MLAPRSRRLSFPSSAVMASAFSALYGTTNNSSQFTVTALGRWSVLSKQLPAVEKIKALHVYDFDNTLFKTPLPNPSLWQGQTIGLLSNQDTFVNGGWWHDNRILAATGEGLEKEEPRGWDGWWNEKILELVKLSIKQPDALCVLLTGRSEPKFSSLIKRMIASQDLEFDMVGLKPPVSPTNQRFQSTMHFKQLFLTSLMETYKLADEIRVYEDRPKHTKGFREFFTNYNSQQNAYPSRGPITAEVIQVPDCSTTLDPVVEVAEVQHMINSHNQIASKQSSKKKLRIKKTVFFTSYTVGPEDSDKLVKLARLPANFNYTDLIWHGNNILICPRPCPASILDKVGGMGSKMKWEVTDTGHFDNSIWAARLRPVPLTAKYHTDNPVPLIVLALKKGMRPIDAGRIDNWQPIPQDRTFMFETVIGEKVILRIEPDDPREDEYESLFANKSSKRKHTGDDEWAGRNTSGTHGGRNDTRGYHTSARGGRGRGGQNRGNKSHRGGRGRGRGGFYNYRSLDDVEPKAQQGGQAPQVDYDDSFPSLPPRQPNGHNGWQGQANQRPLGKQAGGGQDLQNYY